MSEKKLQPFKLVIAISIIIGLWGSCMIFNFIIGTPNFCRAKLMANLMSINLSMLISTLNLSQNCSCVVKVFVPGVKKSAIVLILPFNSGKSLYLITLALLTNGLCQKEKSINF